MMSNSPVELEAVSEGRPVGYVLIKRGLYWKPDAQGYTALLSEAGIYSADKSAAYASAPDGYTPSTRRILASVADEVAPGASDEHKAAYWKGRAEAMSSELLALREAGRHIRPYLNYTVGPESPGFHPTMPSAVAAFNEAFGFALLSPTPEDEVTK